MNIVLISFDPSIVRTGWAIRSVDGYLDAGVIVPPKKGTIQERLQSLYEECHLVAQQGDDITHAVVEWGSGHVDHKRHRGGGFGLATYGAACCTIWRAMLDRGYAVHCQDVQWCSSIPKAQRPAVASTLFQAYTGERDGGADTADAILLADHRWRELMVQGE